MSILRLKRQNNFDEIERSGYTVIRNFLSSNELELLNRYYHPVYNKFVTTVSSYPVLPIYSPNIVPSVADKIKKLTKIIADTTSVKAELLSRAYPMDNKFVNFGWHQDADLFFIYQEMYNSLNFWIPITKPNAKTANLQVIPFDKLRSLDSKLHDYVKGKGATLFTETGNNTSTFEFYENPVKYNLPYSLNSIADTPELNKGDLLLMRGDVIHKSQPSSDHRIAISYRTFNKNGLIYKDKFYQGMNNGAAKKRYIERNISDYTQLIDHFEKYNSIPIPLIEVKYF